jgi:thiamine pyrophosphate-dependent acetolactate synthase large subunit-like protein
MATYQDYDNIIDWHEVVESVGAQVETVLSLDDAEDFKSRWLSKDGLTTIHPVTGEEVHILDSTEQEDEMKEAEDELKKALEVQWGSGRNSGSSNSEKNGAVRQGTL